MNMKHILAQDKNSIMKKVFDAQVKFPTKEDWLSELQEILKELTT